LIGPAALVSRSHTRPGVAPVLLTILCAAHPSPASQADAPPANVRFVESRLGMGSAKPFAVAAVDLNGDGKLDLAATDLGNDSVTLLLANGDGTFRRSGAFVAGRIPRGLAAADVNADGKPDLVIAGGQKNTVEVLFGDGKGSGKLRSYRARIAPFNVAVADLNGDAHLDVAVANESNIDALKGKGEVSLLFGDGRGELHRGPVLVAGSNPADVKAADLNGDGRTDLAVVNWDSLDVSLFFAQAGGGFSAASSVPYGGASAYTLAVEDLDGDRTPEIVVGDARGDVFVLRREAAGTFHVAEKAHADRGLRSLAVADLDGDGRPDVATANTGADSITVLLHRKDGFAAPAQFAVGKGPRWVVAADIDADGRMDLVVANGTSGDLSILLNRGPTDVSILLNRGAPPTTPSARLTPPAKQTMSSRPTGG
jgi:FG-GAP-like repeat